MTTMTRRFGPAGTWRQGGLGQNTAEQTVWFGVLPVTVDCSSPNQYYLYPGCWTKSLSEWAHINDMSNLGPAASPQTVQTLQQQWSQTDVTMCQQDPTGCAAYQAANAASQGNACSLLMPSPLDQMFCNSDGSVNWTAILLIGGGVLVLLMGIRG